MSVKALRVNAGLTQQEVADKLGINIKTYTSKEAGTIKWWADEYAALAKIFNVDIKVFFSSLKVAD